MANHKRRGRPVKTDPTDPKAIAKRIDEQKMAFGARCADNLDKLFNNMYTIALLDETASPTNKISCTKYCLDYAQKFLEDEATEVPEGYDGEDKDEEDNNMGALISLKAVN